MITKAKRDLLRVQIQKEIDFARKYKAPNQPRWKRNEDMYLGRKKTAESSRSNVMLPKMQGFVDTLLSKVDSAPNIKYLPGEEADLIKARRLNALKDKDSSPMNGNWAFKDLLGKKHGIIYGRTIFEYHANSLAGKGYKSHFNLVDTADFLIDPAAGGLDIEKGKYMGRAGIIRTQKELKEGKKDKKFIGAEVDHMLREGSTDEEAVEEKAKENRYFALVEGSKRLNKADEFNNFEWCTTFEGVRYFVEFNEHTSALIKCEELKDVFKAEIWPYLSYATSPSATEFWTPAPCDAVAEIFMAESVIVNQQLDNNEEINKPMKGFDVGAVENPALLKWRKDGNIPFKKGTNLDQAFKVYRPEALQNNERLYQILDSIAQTESGVTNAAKGIGEEDKVGIYEGNLANAADRLSLLNKSYTNAYHRLGLLYYHGVKEHLNKKMAIKMIGNDGITYEEITKSQVMPIGREFDIDILSSEAELGIDIQSRKDRLVFLTENRDNEIVNQQVLLELAAEIVGFEPVVIKRLMDTDVFGDSEVIAEAASDFQEMLNGGIPVEPNPRANIAYAKYMVDALTSKGKHMSPEVQAVVIDYMTSIQGVVAKNTQRKANKVISEDEVASNSLAAPEQEPQV